MTEEKQKIEYASIGKAALSCKCPSCLKGDIFEGFLDLKEQCPSCGLDLTKHDSGDGPAVFIIFILGFLIVPISLWIAMIVAWPLWVHAIVWSIVTLACTAGMLRPAKALTLAAQFHMRGDLMTDSTDPDPVSKTSSDEHATK